MPGSRRTAACPRPHGIDEVTLARVGGARIRYRLDCLGAPAAQPWIVGVNRQLLEHREGRRSYTSQRLDLFDELRTLITISRTHASDVGQRQIFVRLDGQPRPPLVYGDSLTIEVQPGAHHLRVHNTLMWRNIRFAVEAGEHLEFVVINTCRWWTYGMVGVLGSAPLFLRVEKRVRN